MALAYCGSIKYTASTFMKINHILIKTSDLSNMASFLGKITNLKEGHRPPFPFHGVWMYHDDKPVIHLMETQANSAQADYLGSPRVASQSTDTGAVDHIAFEGDDYEQLISKLARENIHYVERTVPLSREHQVFISGPDGLKLEILFNQNKISLTTAQEYAHV